VTITPTIPADVETIVRVAQEATDPAELEPGKIYAFVADGRVHQVDLTGDRYLDSPRRKRGDFTVRDVDSFLAYWHKHHDDESDIWADREALTVTAVLDAHGTEPGWGEHRLTMRLRHTDSFTAWTEVSGRALSQQAFAEFIEDHRPDIRTPSAAELLELAQTFQATTKATFRQQSILKSGQRALQWVEQVEASAGRDGQITIPDQFELALKVFDGADVADAVTARLRYRINDGRLFLIFILDQIREVVDGAYQGVLDGVLAGVDVPVLRGTPASPPH
jgi:uncharacterized protein YfdQ (DUF2303 family)